MAEAAVACLLEQLKDMMGGYADLIAEAEKEFDQLKQDLDSLKEMAKKKKKDKTLERKIRDVVYEVEDTIDTCLTKAIELKPRNSILHSIGFKSASLAKEVKAVREQKVRPLFNHADGDGAKAGDEPPPTETSKKDAPIGQKWVIGFDDEEAKITAYLNQKRDKLDVMSIVGVPGQGKTTLAWKIYQNESICFNFTIRIWVRISQVFHRRDVFLQILESFSPSQDRSSLCDEELAQAVRTCLKNEKFLIVLDDLWSVDAWEKIQEVLPLDNGDGKVLITTTEKAVGEQSQVYRAPHNLKFLPIDNSWELLQYEVFGDLNKCPENLKGIGEQIATKCNGVPLMIVVIGGILKDQLLKPPLTAEHEWQAMSQSVSEALENRATRITEVVELSYHRLPDDLKDCFVFLGVFPEDYEIPAKTLCGLWIYEGFVLPRQGRSMEESAEENMNDLIGRNLLKPEKTNHMGKVKTCRVHDMIRAFCISKIKEDNLCDEVRKSSEPGELEPSDSQLQKSHRLCFHSILSEFLCKNPSGPHVRSIMCFHDVPVMLGSEHLAVIPHGFKKLRILESKSIKLEQFPGKVVKLVHLRYLTLYIETLKILPETITQLWNLQSLVVETKCRSISMKANLWRMVRLRCLKTRAAIVLESTKSDGKAGQNLHTLNRLAPESCTDVVSEKAVNLKTLGISGKLIASIFEKNFLEKLHHLEKLKLHEHGNEDTLPLLPPRNCFPPNLKRLTLMNTSLEWKHMSTLAMIETLEVLKLKDNAFVGACWMAGENSFSHLQMLLIANTDLVIWEASSESFPKLKCLVLKNCENLIEIPEALAETLEKLEVERLQESAVASARSIIEAKKLAPVRKDDASTSR